MFLTISFIDVMWTILGAIVFCIVLGLIVIVHEGGHFFFAKKAGILCHEFSIGMGPLVWQKKKGETFYSIRAIPLGGFVSMAGEEVEFDILKGVKKVKLGFDKEGKVNKIVFNLDNPKYNDLLEYEVIDYNLIGTKKALEDELFITVKDANNEESMEQTFIVKRDTIVNYQKKDELQIAPWDRNFVNKPLKNRFMAVFAGPMMNFIFAVILFFIIGLFQGYPNTNHTKLDEITQGTPAYEIGLREGDVINKLDNMEVKTWDDITKFMANCATGKTLDGNSYKGTIEVTYTKKDTGEVITKTVYPYAFIYTIELALKYDMNDLTTATVGTYSTEEVNKQTKAYKAGLRDGDIITKVNGEEISDRNSLLAYFSSGKIGESKKIKVEVKRLNASESYEIKEFEVEINSDGMLASQNITPTKIQIGISPEYSFNIVKLIYMPWVDTGNGCLTIFKTLGLLFTDSTVNVDDLSGPIGIFELLKEQTKQGLLNIIYWTATLSVNIGLVNLLPLPALDGGRLAFLGYEAITKKKANAKVENIIHTVGFILLMALFVFISFNDVVRCVGKLF